jgi:hypothetical protein
VSFSEIVSAFEMDPEPIQMSAHGLALHDAVLMDMELGLRVARWFEIDGTFLGSLMWKALHETQEV